ncbi:MAG TPA: stalk domain-containing protein [Ruminiclostridium sp.]
MTFNGDILKLTTAPEIENGEILVPLEVFKKIDAVVTTDDQMTKVIIKSSTLAGRNIYINTGSQAAYTNYTGSGDPFNDPAAQDNLITLNNAPKKVGNEVLVSVKAIVDAIGIKVEWNTKTNVVSIQDSTAVKNPMLYNAWKNTLQYKGEYSSSMVISMIENTSNEEFNISYTMKGAVNGLNATAKSNLLVKITGIPDEEYEYDTVNIGNKIYSKDVDTGEWTILDQIEADDQGIMYYDVAADRAETQKLLDAYDKLNIFPAGKAILNGEEVTKYKIKLSIDDLELIIPAELLENGLGLGDIYNKGLDFKTEIFINSQGQLVKQSVKMTGGIEEAGVIVDVKINVDVEFSNIDKDIEIVSPI